MIYGWQSPVKDFKFLFFSKLGEIKGNCEQVHVMRKGKDRIQSEPAKCTGNLKELIRKVYRNVTVPCSQTWKQVLHHETGGKRGNHATETEKVVCALQERQACHSVPSHHRLPVVVRYSPVDFVPSLREGYLHASNVYGHFAPLRWVLQKRSTIISGR